MHVYLIFTLNVTYIITYGNEWIFLNFSSSCRIFYLVISFLFFQLITSQSQFFESKIICQLDRIIEDLLLSPHDRTNTIESSHR